MSGGAAPRRARAVRHVRRDPAQRHGPDHRRDDRPARLRRSSPSPGLTFLGFGVQPPSPDWSLQIADNYQLLNAGTVLVDGALPGPRDRDADRRRQPDRRRAPAGVRPMSDGRSPSPPGARARRAPRRLSRARPGPRRSSAASRSRSSAAGLRARGRVGLRQVDRRARDRPVPPAQRARPGGAIHIAGRDVLTHSRAALRAAPRERRLDGLPEPGRRAEPVDPDRQAGRRGLHRARRRRRRRRSSASTRRSRSSRSPIPSR